MAFREKVEEFAKTAYDKTGEAVEYTKLNARILSEKGAIKDEYKKLGEYMYQAYKSGTTMDDKALDFCRSIDIHNQTIERTQEELKHSKSNRENPKSTNAHSEPETVIVSQVVNATKDEVEMTAEEI